MGEVKRDADFEVYVVVALAAVRVQSLESTLGEGQHRMRAVKGTIKLMTQVTYVLHLLGVCPEITKTNTCVVCIPESVKPIGPSDALQTVPGSCWNSQVEILVEPLYPDDSPENGLGE